MKKISLNKILAASMTLAIALFWTACGSGYSDSIAYGVDNSYMDITEDWGGSYSYPEEESAYSEDYTSSKGTGSTEVVATNRKLITNVTLDLETKSFDTLLGSVQERVKALGGYVENLDNYNGSKYSGGSYNRYAYITARIPKANLDSFLNAVSQEGNVTQRSENVEDVTLNYVDMESRRDMLRKEQERLLEFMDMASSIEEMITIEERLSEVQYEIESMESRLRTYDNQIDYSTVRINIHEVEVLTPQVEESALERMGSGFMENLMSVLIGVRDFFINIFISLPTLILLALIGFILFFVYKTISKRSKKKKAQAEPVMPVYVQPLQPAPVMQ